MRLVPVIDLSTAQTVHLNLDHATVVEPLHVDPKNRVLRRDGEAWTVKFTVTVGKAATVYVTKRMFDSEQDAQAWIAALAEIVD